MQQTGWDCSHSAAEDTWLTCAANREAQLASINDIEPTLSRCNTKGYCRWSLVCKTPRTAKLQRLIITTRHAIHAFIKGPNGSADRCIPLSICSNSFQLFPVVGVCVFSLKGRLDQQELARVVVCFLCSQSHFFFFSWSVNTVSLNIKGLPFPFLWHTGQTTPSPLWVHPWLCRHEWLCFCVQQKFWRRKVTVWNWMYPNPEWKGDLMNSVETWSLGTSGPRGPLHWPQLLRCL